MAKTPLPELRENGSRRRPPQGWKAYWEEVDKLKPRRRTNSSPAQLANLRPKKGRVEFKVFCTATATRTGERCRQAPVTGAERCYRHGGLLEVPHHPANMRHRDRAARSAAREAFFAFDRRTREIVHHAYAEGPKGRRRDYWQILLEGAQALHADKSGQAFRRWMMTLTRQEMAKANGLATSN